MNNLTHIDENGNAVMVDVGAKDITERVAVAQGKIKMSAECLAAITDRRVEKGDVLGVAQVAGIMAAKRTADLIPLCHILNLTYAGVVFETNFSQNEIKTVCTVKCSGKTGVEMEALTGASVALLTIYDMCKAIDKSMVISDVHLLTKTGGKSGDFVFDGGNS